MENKDVLAQVSQRTPGMKVQDFDAMENIPTLAVGEDIQPGQLLTGVFLVTERLTSAKFTYSQERDEATGLPVQYRHILRNGKVKYGIWNCGELKLIFSKIQPGTYVELTYVEKGLNAKGQNQHKFTVKTQVVDAPAN